MDFEAVPILVTKRLRLRSFRRSDIDEYAAMNADPEVMRYLGGAWDQGRAWRHMAFLVGHWQIGPAGMWAVEQRETGAFVGRVGFAQPDGWPGFELAWALARRWWGRGYATESARAALDHAFSSLKKSRIISLIHPENHASIRVAERLGQRLEGRIQHIGREMLCYGIDRKAYGSLQRPSARAAHTRPHRSAAEGAGCEEPGGREASPATPSAAPRPPSC
jgi:RimJ/RimL family protein N-acetyltransferase